MVARGILAVGCLILVVAHYTGNMRQLGAMFDLGIEPMHYLYLAAIPFVGLCGLAMLRS
jgi:hypothetical protein